MIQLLPGRGDELGEQATLLGAGWQTAVRCGPPDACRGRAEDLVPCADRQRKLVERPAETFEQECAAHRVVSQQSHASFPAGESQYGDLVLGRVTATGHDQLQHGGGAVCAGRFRDERLVESV